MDTLKDIGNKAVTYLTNVVLKLVIDSNLEDDMYEVIKFWGRPLFFWLFHFDISFSFVAILQK